MKADAYMIWHSQIYACYIMNFEDSYKREKINSETIRKSVLVSKEIHDKFPCMN